MLFYSLAMFVSGKLGDRYNKKIILVIGMIMTSFTLLFFGYVSERLHIYNTAWYFTFWILNAIAQSTAWPILIAIMGSWLNKSSEGKVMGMWSSCASFGNIVGSEIAAIMLPSGYENVFMVSAIWILIVATLIMVFLKSDPSEAGFIEIQSVPSTSDTEALVSSTENTSSSVEFGFCNALKLPGVILCSLCFACLKIVVYGFFFWLPFYLHNKYGWDEYLDDQLSIWFDVGSVAGGIILGWISDKLGFRITVIEVSILVSIPFLIVYNDCLPAYVWINAIFMCILGLLIGGCNSIMGTAVTHDLANHPMAQGRAMSTVAGIIDGTGSFGAALGQLVIPIIQQLFGWDGVFVMFVLSLIIAWILLLPMFIDEIKQIWRNTRATVEDS
ncbi:hypothetical protein GJ496_005354 [Pomphorhynchus laevis]|nr:hypothetical protein GJ496_005354 [Pomphorhynchus laevis]